MQISRHWRLNSQRYSLAGERLGGEVSLRGFARELEPRDKRHLGAMLVVGNEEGEVLMIEDEAKLEDVGGFQNWSRGTKLNFVGGGQLGREPAHGTIRREFEEELDKLTRDVLGRDFQVITPYPFVVTQLSNNRNWQVNQITAVVFGKTVDSNDDLWRQMITSGAKPIRAEIVASQLDGYENSWQQYRPQAMVAAACYLGWLQKQDIITLNQLTVGRAHDLSQYLNCPIQNGIINMDGEINNNLHPDIYSYLNTFLE